MTRSFPFHRVFLNYITINDRKLREKREKKRLKKHFWYNYATVEELGVWRLGMFLLQPLPLFFSCLLPKYMSFLYIIAPRFFRFGR